MKIEPRLPQLPSLSELLEHPRVKGLVERVNRSTIAQRAGGFLEEMRSSLAERAGRLEIPSLTHLAERLARRLLGEPGSTGPVINATGVVLGDPALAAPLAEQALHAIVQLGGEYHRRGTSKLSATERSLSELAGGEAAWLTNSFEGALTLAVAIAAGNRELAVCGAVEGAGEIDWRWVAARAGAALRIQAGNEQGQADRGCDVAAAAVVRAPDAEGVDLAALASAKANDACLIDVAPIAGTLNPQGHGYQSVGTIHERLAAGADLVVIDGGGLLAGPACGILIGSRRWIEPLGRHPLASMLAIDALPVAALDAVLKLYRDEATPAIYQLPVWQLLSAPLANLEQRAVRLAALMAETEAIATAEPRLVDSPWRRSAGREWMAKSWVVELGPKASDVASFAARLEQGPHPIAARRGDGVVQIDLRTVFPRWDQQLVAAIESME